MANSKIHSIISEIEKRILTCEIKSIERQDILTGKIGLAYSCLHIYKVCGNNVYLDKISEILDDIFCSISENKSVLQEKISLADGISGLGIVLHKLVKEDLIDVSIVEQINLITQSVYNKCKDEIKKENFDYFYGSCGLLYYLLEIERYNEVDEVVQIIHEYATKHDFLFDNNVDDPYSGGINFGFAHGSFSLLAIFLRIYDQAIQPVKTKELITNVLDRLLSFSCKYVDYGNVTIKHKGFDYPSFFPYNVTMINKNSKIYSQSPDAAYHFTDRLGWCNSDLSRLYILYLIGKKFNVHTYTEFADEVSQRVLVRREFKDTAISDCYMCHGSSGVAHIYKRLFDITNDNVYYDSYEFWIKRTIEYMEAEVLKRRSDRDLELLTGWLTPYFVLKEYDKTIYKNWDSIFLLNNT